MDNLESLSRGELIALIKTFEKRERPSDGGTLVEHLTHELSVHREELTMQNQELREMAAELESSRNRYANLYDFAPVGYVTVNEQGNIHEINLTGCWMFGKERKQLIGRPLHSYLPSAERLRFLTFLQSAISAGQRVSDDFTLKFQSRPELHLQFDAIPVRETEETLLWMSITDVTSRYASEEELKHSQASLSAVIENTQDAIWSVDRKYEIVTANIAFEALRGSVHPLGVPKGSTAATPVVIRWREYYDRALRGERFSIEEKYTLAGKEQYFELSFNPIFTRSGISGEISGISVFAKNITARKQLDDTLRESKERAEAQSKYRANVLSNLSHELRTPLNAILSYTHLIDEIAVKQEVKDYVEVVHRNGERLVHMVNHALDLARLEAGNVTVDLRVVDPRELVEQQVRLLKPLAQQQGLFLRLGPSSSALVRVDRALFEQVLTNLIGNAIKYTESGGITIEITSGLDEVEIRVRDSGIGISEEFLPHIFEEFKREPNELNDRVEGSGLGLSITRKQVEIMGGRVGGFSEHGAGSTFWVRFPKADLSQESALSQEIRMSQVNEEISSNGQRRPAHRPLQESRLLLVEDDGDQAEGLKAVLENEWQIDIAKNGEMAIFLADRYSYDGVLLDLALGNGMNGFDVSRRLRKSPRFTKVPIIAMTGNPEFNREGALLSGCDAFLIKPVTSEVVSKALERLLAETS